MRRFLTWRNLAGFCNQHQKATEGTESTSQTQTSTVVQKKISEDEDVIKAVWAQAIFDEVKNAPLKNFDQTKTLVDHLRSFKLPDRSKLNLQKLVKVPDDIEKVRQEMMKMFDPLTGVILPDPVFNAQSRFTDGSINKTSNKLAFYPNTFVSSTVFGVVNETFGSPSTNLIVGEQGISKSMSLLLAWHLSSITTKFRFNSPSMVAKLVEKNLIKNVFPKIIYVSFRNSVEGMEDYGELLKCQCPEAQKQIGQIVTLPKDPEFISEIASCLKRTYLKKNIKTLVVMDQINTLAKKFHESNVKIKEAAEEVKKDVTKTKTIYNIEYTEPFKIVNQQQKFYKTLKGKFPLLLNSSSNLQQRLLYGNDRPNQIYYALDVMHHSKMTTHSCSYDRINFMNIREMYRFIWYSCSRFLVSKGGFFEDSFIESCDMLAVKSEEICSLMTPYTINLTMKKIQPSLVNLLVPVSELEQELSSLLAKIKSQENKQKKSRLANIFVEAEYNVLKTLLSEEVTQSRINDFVENQVFLPSLTKYHLYLHQKVMELIESEPKEKETSKQEKEKPFLSKLKICLTAKKALSAEQLEKLKKEIEQQLDSLVIKEAEIRKAQPKMNIKQKTKRFKEYIQNKTKTGCPWVTKLKIIEACELKKMNEPDNKQFTQLKKVAEEILSSEQFPEASKRLETMFKKFVKNEDHLRGLPNEKKNLVSRILAFAETLSSSLSAEQQTMKTEKFIQEELKGGNLPDLRNLIKLQVQTIVKEVEKSIEKQGIEQVKAKAANHLRSSNLPAISRCIYSIAFDCASYYHEYKNSPNFKSIPLTAFSNVSTNEVKQYYNRDLFEYNESEQALDLKVSKKELGAVSIMWMFQNFGLPGKDYTYSGALAGMLIEYFIILWLRENPVCGIFVDKDLIYQTIGLKNFEHFYSPGQKANIRQTLEPLVEEAKSSKLLNYCIGIPVTASQLKEGQADTSSNSPKFDLLLLRYIDDKIEITTIDFTANQDQNEIDKKKSEALDLIKELLQYNYQNLGEIGPLAISNWTHIVACRKQMASDQPTNQNWDYYTSKAYEKKLQNKKKDLADAIKEKEKAETKLASVQSDRKKKKEAENMVKNKTEKITQRNEEIKKYQVWMKQAQKTDPEGVLFKTSIKAVTRDISKILLIKKESQQSADSLDMDYRVKKLLSHLEIKPKPKPKP